MKRLFFVAASAASPFVLGLACQKAEPLPPRLQNPGGPVIGPVAGGPGADGSIDALSLDVEAGTLAVLAQGIARPVGLTLDPSYVYWTYAGSAVDVDGAVLSNSGGVQRVPRGGGTVTPLVAGQDFPQLIQYANASVFWNNAAGADGGSVVAFDLGAGSPRTLALGQFAPYGIAADAANVYWTSSNDGAGVLLQSVPRGGGPSNLIATLSGDFLPGPLAITTADAFFLISYPGGGGALYRAALIGDNPEQLWSSNAGLPAAITVDGTNVYWTVMADAPAGLILAVPTGGGAVTTLASGQARPGGVAVDATNLYWTSDVPAPDGAILFAPLAGGSASTLATGLDAPRAIVVADAVYFTTSSDIVWLAK